MEMGLPVVLVCHVPFFTPKLCESNLQLTRREDAFLTGLPLDISSQLRYDPALPPSEEWRNSAIQQKASAMTLKFTEWLRQQKPLKAILTGHCHHFFAEPFSSTAVQYVVGPQFYGEALEITFLRNFGKDNKHFLIAKDSMEASKYLPQLKKTLGNDFKYMEREKDTQGFDDTTYMSASET